MTDNGHGMSIAQSLVRIADALEDIRDAMPSVEERIAAVVFSGDWDKHGMPSDVSRRAWRIAMRFAGEYQAAVAAEIEREKV